MRGSRQSPGVAPIVRYLGYGLLLLFLVASAWPMLTGSGPTDVSPATTSGPAGTPDTAEDKLIVPDVSVYDRDGQLVYQGDVDLAPELARIEAGIADPHDNDGSVFQNRERRLPVMDERDYYREYVVRTPGLDEVGPQRLVIGAGGEVYYTTDHYLSFIRIR
jgi:filamentous hemagglutinin